MKPTLSILFALALAIPALGQPFSFGDQSVFGGKVSAMVVCSTNTDSELITQTTGSSVFQLTGNNWRGQGFYLSASTTVTEIVLKLRDDGSDVGSARVSIYSDSSGKPATEIAGTSVDVAASDIGSSSVEVHFVLSAPVVLAAGTNHIVLRSVNGAAITFSYNDGDIYAGGLYNYSSDAGGSWTTYAADIYFRVFGCQ